MDGGQKDLAPKPRIVQFKGEQGRIQQVNLGNLEAVFANIETHNQEFSLGAMLAKGISSHIRDEGNEGSEGSRPFSAEKDKRDALSETLGIIHADSFSPIGISFDTASETGVKLIAQDEQIAETRIKFGLQNPDLFLSFLGALSAVDKQELSGSQIPSLIGKIGRDVLGQVRDHYTDVLRDERAPVIAQRLNEIVLSYRKLGVEVPKDMEIYAKYSQQGILREYVVVDLNKLLAKPNKDASYGFEYGSLANWRNDIGLDLMQGRWDRAVSVLQQMKGNPKAKELSEEVKSNLLSSIELALRDIDTKDDGWDVENKWVKRKDKKEVFENARINLQLV